MKKIIVSLALAATLSLTACGGSGTPAVGTTDTPVVEVSKALDLTGTWKQSNSNSEDTYQQATITADTITIDWVMDGGESTSVYWVGSMKAPNNATDSFAWSSTRDAAATDTSLLASTDDVKEFTFEGNTVSYKVSALGTTMTVKLKKK